MVRPYLPISQPSPPPRVSPAMPVLDTTPPVVARPWPGRGAVEFLPRDCRPGPRPPGCRGVDPDPASAATRSIIRPPSVTALTGDVVAAAADGDLGRLLAADARTASTTSGHRAAAGDQRGPFVDQPVVHAAGLLVRRIRGVDQLAGERRPDLVREPRSDRSSALLFPTERTQAGEPIGADTTSWRVPSVATGPGWLPAQQGVVQARRHRCEDGVGGWRRCWLGEEPGQPAGIVAAGKHQHRLVATLQHGVKALTGTTRPRRMTRLTQATPLPSSPPTRAPSAAEPAATANRCNPSGSCRSRTLRLHGSGPLVCSGTRNRRSSAGSVPPWTMTENATTTKMISYSFWGLAATRLDDEHAEQDRHRALEAGPHEQPLAAGQPEPPQQRPGQYRADDQRQVPPRAPVRQPRPVDGQACNRMVRPSIVNATISARLASVAWNRAISRW